MSGTLYILEHKDLPGLIHVGMTKGSALEAQLGFSRLTGLTGQPRLYAKLKVAKPRRLLRAMLISVAPYRVSRHFHRIDPEQATDLLIYLANHKGRIQSLEKVWPAISSEDHTFMRLMDKARKITEDKKYRNKKGKKSAATVIDIRKIKKGKKGKRFKYARAS